MTIENQYTDEQNRLIGEKNLFSNFKAVIDANTELQNEPKFILGHSLGALYALRFCQLHPELFRGCILVNPLLEFQQKVGSFKKASLFMQKNKIIDGKLKKFDDMDEFCPEGHEMSISTYLQILNIQAEAYGRLGKTKTPMLFIDGENDKFVDSSMLNVIFNEMKNVKHKKFATVEKEGHYMMDEENCETPQKYSFEFV